MDTFDLGKAPQDSSFGLKASRDALEGKINEFINELSSQDQARYSLVRSRKESHTEHVQIVMYRHINGSGRLFGGALLQMIDTIGAICARRHSGSEVTTVAIDNLSFKAPASINSTLLLIAEIQSVGRTSMKVQVTTYVESLNGSREEINVANLTFVAIDRYNRPIPVPRLKEMLPEAKI